MASNESNTPSGHRFNNMSISGGKAHLGDAHYHYTSEDPSKELEKKLDACRNELLLTDPLVDLETLKSTKGHRTEGTCEWIRDNEAYKSWLRGNSQCLWINGGPGKGKTMLSIFLTEEIEKHRRDMGDILLLFYFCSNQDEKRNSAATVLRSLLYQMLTKCRDLFAPVSSYFEQSEKTQMVLSSAEILWVIFRTLLQSSPYRVFCVLDGLDECDEASSRLLGNKFRDYFSPARSGRPCGGFNLVIVSRKITGLEDFSQVKLDPDNDENVRSDIQHFISARVQELERVPEFNRIREEVKVVLLERAQDTFLWVGFVMGELSKKRTCSGIMESLNGIPPGLDAVYNRMLRQAERGWQTESTRQSIIPDILRWVTVAARPLTLRELMTAMALTTKINDAPVVRDQIFICEPILKIQRDQVSLVHQSAREYLLREKPDDDPILKGFHIEAEEAHAQLGRTCLDIVERSDLCHKRLDLDDASILQNSPLLRYAALHWPEHLRRSSTYSEKDLSLSRPLFHRGSPLLVNWWYSYLMAMNFHPDFSIDRPTLFSIACFFGIASLAQKLSRNSWRNKFRKIIYRKDEQEHWALRIAAFSGDESTVQLLVTQGVDINAVDKAGCTVPIYAIAGGQEVIVQLILAQGADIHAVHKGRGTALRLAAAKAQEAIVQLLVAQNADINAIYRDGKTALIMATKKKQEAIVHLLLAAGATYDGAGASLSSDAQDYLKRRSSSYVSRRKM